jgi:hypothetical protein
MKRLNWVIAALFCAMTAPAMAVSDINFFLGQKNLDSSDWGANSYLGYGLSLDQQGELGILANFAGHDWPVSIAVDLLISGHQVDACYSSVGCGSTTAGTVEIDVGARKIFNIYGTSFHPYVGGGLALITGSIEDDYYYYYDNDSDSGAGLWLNGGIFWSIGHFNLGLDARFSEADVTLYGQTVNAGGSHGGIFLGFNW